MTTKSTLFALLATALLAAPACDSAADKAPEAKVSDAAPAKAEEKPADAPKAEAPAKARSLALVADKSSVEFVGAKVTADHRGKFGAPNRLSSSSPARTRSRP